MATVDRSEANRKMIQQTHEVQDKTKEAIWRIQRQAAEAEQIGTKTLEELNRQGQLMDNVHSEIASVNAKLDHSKALQNRFSRWAGNFGNFFTRGKAGDLPAETVEKNDKSEFAEEIVRRNEERKNKASASRQLEKAGYVPRSKQASESGLTSGGMMKRGKVAKDQELDEESAAGHKKTTENEAEINAGIAAIDRTLDNLNSLAGAMKTEVLQHNEKLGHIENSMQNTTEKQAVVNDRQRKLLR